MIYFTLLQRIGSVGVGIGILFLGEVPQPSAWIGLAFVIVSVVAMTLPTGRRVRPA